jgi:Ca2+-binding EF-hand superfamily protein
MRSFVRWCFVALSAAGFVGAVLAQNAPNAANQFRETFDQLDANHDKAVERSEVPESARAAFDKLLARGDKNHDGKLEPEEYRAVLADIGDFARQARDQMIHRFDTMDLDHDKKLTRAEFTGPTQRFDILDKNADGAVTREEFLGVVAAAAKKGANKKALEKPAAKKKAGAALARLLQQFAQLDKNNDGKISRDEFPGMDAAFDRLDTDFDNALSRKEVEKAAEFMKKFE